MKIVITSSIQEAETLAKEFYKEDEDYCLYSGPIVLYSGEEHLFLNMGQGEGVLLHVNMEPDGCGIDGWPIEPIDDDNHTKFGVLLLDKRNDSFPWPR